MKTFKKWVEGVDELGMAPNVDTNYILNGVEKVRKEKEAENQRLAAFNASPQGVLSNKIRATVQALAPAAQQLSQLNAARDGYAPKAYVLQKYPQLMDSINQLAQQLSQINVNQELQAYEQRPQT